MATTAQTKGETMTVPATGARIKYEGKWWTVASVERIPTAWGDETIHVHLERRRGDGSFACRTADPRYL